jgi:hypothetical protein
LLDPMNMFSARFAIFIPGKLLAKRFDICSVAFQPCGGALPCVPNLPVHSDPSTPPFSQ